MDFAPAPRNVLAAPDQPHDHPQAHRDPRRQNLAQWEAALERGDHAEVDRLVRQSRLDRSWIAASGQLGMMLG